jgi:hypothetical protein
MGILIFKVLTARRLFKRFGIKELMQHACYFVKLSTFRRSKLFVYLGVSILPENFCHYLAGNRYELGSYVGGGGATKDNGW